MNELILVNNGKQIRLKKPISISRKVSSQLSSNCFNLPKLKISPFKVPEEFLGDVNQGGTCNVDIICYTPHNITHIETSAHILERNSESITIDRIEKNAFCGVVYVIDLSEITYSKANLITWDLLKDKLKNLEIPCDHIAIKTEASLLPEDYDFSEKNFISIDPLASKKLHDFSYQNKKLKGLILDLPSADIEKDGGKLLAHRNFFGLPEGITNYIDIEKRIIVELAHFKDVEEGYYYMIMTPSLLKVNAIATDIWIYKLAI